MPPPPAAHPSHCWKAKCDNGSGETTRECGRVELEAVTVPSAVREGWAAVPAHRVDAHSVCRHTGEPRGIPLRKLFALKADDSLWRWALQDSSRSQQKLWQNKDWLRLYAIPETL